MTTIVVPPLDDERWPTLGPQLVAWIEANLVYGPGPLKGEDYVVEPEFRAQLYRMYEVFPRGHDRAGYRRFKTCVLSLRKGTAKSEKAAIVAIAESHPDAPVRADGFHQVDGMWVPVGRGIQDPYIPMVAYTAEQAEEIAYGAVKTILENCAIGEGYDIGIERIHVLDRIGRAAGTIKALAGAPSARDGARTSHQHFDETHRLNLPNLVKAHATMGENTFKRRDADAWSFETTTAFEPGDKSVAEVTHNEALDIAEGKVAKPTMFFFHRQAPDDAPLPTGTDPISGKPVVTPDDVRAALLEASGPAASWSADIEGLVDRWFSPKTDLRYYRRVWLNQVIAGLDKAFDLNKFKSLTVGPAPADGTQIVMGFDGARFHDSTCLWGCTEQGLLFKIHVQERPPHAEEWEVDAAIVDSNVDAAFKRWDVVRFYADPPYWDDYVDRWIVTYGEERVIAWHTKRTIQMAEAIRSFVNALDVMGMSHDGSQELISHLGNAHKISTGHKAGDGEFLWVVYKERPDSPRKIDAAMAAILAWEARGDAIAKGLFVVKKRFRARSWT